VIPFKTFDKTVRFVYDKILKISNEANHVAEGCAL
jgi:uncharacterized protein (DUF2062 family)